MEDFDTETRRKCKLEDLGIDREILLKLIFKKLSALQGLD